jgi:hypothetical protein
MPCYPALALLIGSAMVNEGKSIRVATRIFSALSFIAGFTAIGILIFARHVPTPEDTTAARSRHASACTLSLGHMEDLTLHSFSYLRAPLAIPAFAFILGAIGTI